MSEIRDGLLIDRCACGGELVAVRDTPDELRNAVAFHQATPEHGRWRLERERHGEAAELIGFLTLRRGGRPLRADVVLELAGFGS